MKLDLNMLWFSGRHSFAAHHGLNANAPRTGFLSDGYISVDHVELDIQEMMQMGKRAATSYPDSSSNSVLDGAASIMSNR